MQKNIETLALIGPNVILLFGIIFLHWTFDNIMALYIIDLVATTIVNVQKARILVKKKLVRQENSQVGGMIVWSLFPIIGGLETIDTKIGNPNVTIFLFLLMVGWSLIPQYQAYRRDFIAGDGYKKYTQGGLFLDSVLRFLVVLFVHGSIEFIQLIVRSQMAALLVLTALKIWLELKYRRSCTQLAEIIIDRFTQ